MCLYGVYLLNMVIEKQIKSAISNPDIEMFRKSCKHIKNHFFNNE